jgi:hypothetical protein
MTINIAGIDKAQLLVALVNKHPLHIIQKDISIEHARRFGEELEWDFDYVDGIPLKINIAGDSFDSFLYDRGAYEGLAAHIVSRLLSNK